MTVNFRKSLPGVWRTPEVEAEIARIVVLWNDCLERYGGPFLCGCFSIADAMRAPVIARFTTYGMVLPGRCQRYVETILKLPAMQKWDTAARGETEVLPQFEYADTP
jgi:glutathione S-transferase